MEKTTINNSAKKSVRVNANGAAAAFAKANTPQMYCKSEVVLDSQFVNNVVGGLVSIIFSGIEAGVRVKQESRKADDERALWLKNHGLTAGEVADLLYVPGVPQELEKKAEITEVQPQQSVEHKRRHRGGRKHRKPVSPVTKTNNESANHTVAKPETVPPTVQRPRQNPVDKLKEVIVRDPELGRELMSVLEKHRVNLSELLEDD